MRPNRDGKAVVPGKGGYDSEIIEVTGGPERVMPMPPAKSRGQLIPMGDGEGSPYRPGPGALLRKRVPLIPTEQEVGALPGWARVAFAARCARRARPARGFLPKAAGGDSRAGESTITLADQTAARTTGGTAPAEAAEAVRAAVRAADLLLKTATTDTPLTAQLRCIRRDFARLKRLAREQKWTDDTPVPPEVFGPLWPEGVAPYRAAEPAQAPSAPRAE